MRRFVLVFTLLASIVSAQTGAPAHTKVELIALQSAAIPGQTLQLALRFRSEPSYHIYWLNPGDAGEAPQAKWTKTTGLSLRTQSVGDWPAPKRIDLSGVMNFCYEGETHLFINGTVDNDASGQIELVGVVEWLECDDKGCYPQQSPVRLILPVAPSATPTLSTSAKAQWESLPRREIRISGAISADGQTLHLKQMLSGDSLATVLAPQEWFPVTPFVDASAKFSPVAMTAAPANATGNVTATALAQLSLKDAPEPPKAGTTVRYIAKVKDRRTQVSSWVQVIVDLTSLETQPKTEATSETTLPDSRQENSFDWLPWSPEAEAKAIADGKTVYIDFTARWCATCQVNKRVYADADLQAAFTQAGVVTFKADWTRKDAVITEELNRLGRQGIPLNVFRRKDAAPVILSELLTADQVRAGLKASLENRAIVPERRSTLGYLALAFLGGALLNLMPCVFPVIGLKVLAFASQAGSDRTIALRQSIAYALGVLLSFLVLGAIALGLKSGWGAQMQSPLFVLLTTALMVTMGMSLAGAFEIGTGLASQVGSSGNTSALLSGVLATAVATPCTAPGLGAALGFALDPARSTLETLAFFAVIGLGMALPYVLLVAFPMLNRALPRPGEWMETLKQAMAFPLFGYALYLLWVLSALVEDAGWVRDASLGLVVLAGCCWIWGRWGAPHRSDRERIWGRSIAGALYVATLAHLAYHLP